MNSHRQSLTFRIIRIIVIRIGMLQKIKSFLEESRQEFKRINWPTFAQTRRLTLIVIGLSLTVAIFLGVLDFIFSYLLDKFFIS